MNIEELKRNYSFDEVAKAFLDGKDVCAEGERKLEEVKRECSALRGKMKPTRNLEYTVKLLECRNSQLEFEIAQLTDELRGSSLSAADALILNRRRYLEELSSEIEYELDALT